MGTPSSSPVPVPVDRGGRRDVRQHVTRNAECLEQHIVPVQRMQVHQLGAAGVGHVGHVQSGEMPQQPGIDRAEQQIALFRTQPRVGDVVQQPAQLQRAEIAGQRQAGLGTETVLAAVSRVIRHQGIGSRILPDQGVVNRLARGAVPQQGRLALIGDADGGEVAPRQSGAAQRLGDHRLGVAPDFDRIVFHPAGHGIDLPVLVLRHGDGIAGTVEHDEAGAGRALVDGADVAGHGEHLWVRVPSLARFSASRCHRPPDSRAVVGQSHAATRSRPLPARAGVIRNSTSWPRSLKACSSRSVENLAILPLTSAETRGWSMRKSTPAWTCVSPRAATISPIFRMRSARRTRSSASGRPSA